MSLARVTGQPLRGSGRKPGSRARHPARLGAATRCGDEPNEVMLRHMSMRGSVVVAMCLLTACGESSNEVGPVLYGVTYSGVPTDAAVTRFAECSRLPGASLGGGKPDQRLVEGFIRFRGTKQEQVSVVACLTALPQSRVTGPTRPGRM